MTTADPAGRGVPRLEDIPVIRTEVVLRPDPRRVISKPFFPDESVFPDGGLLGRILDMPEEEVVVALADVRGRFTARHLDLDAALEKHFAFVATESGPLPEMSPARRLLIGAFYTHEFSIEATGLTNPSMVPDPDQSGLAPGSARFILSLRGIGEGHTSSIEFRSGVVDSVGGITMEEAAPRARTGTRRPATFDKVAFLVEVEEIDGFDETARSVMSRLPDRFELSELEAAIDAVEGKGAHRRLSAETTRAMHWLATSNYVAEFDPRSKLSERVLFPGSPNESHGLEDARFVRFVDDDGEATYYATYTAYDGFHVLPQLIETPDFRSFAISTLSGARARNKGAALFPRKIAGRFVALSRYDAESNYVMFSDNPRVWETAHIIEAPSFAWDLGRIGNCGSPLETEAGWLVITHGVGPMRTYSLGAILLDIDDPARVIGSLGEPILVPSESERDGYVPNVVYSCGSMIHRGELILPYGSADMFTRIARVPVDALLGRLTG